MSCFSTECIYFETCADGPTLRTHAPSRANSRQCLIHKRQLCRRINICEFVTHLNPAQRHQKANMFFRYPKKNVWRFPPQPWKNFLIFFKKNFFTRETLFSSKKGGKTKKEFVYKIFKPRYLPSYCRNAICAFKLAFIKTNSYYFSLVNFFLNEQSKFSWFCFANRLKIEQELGFKEN